MKEHANSHEEAPEEGLGVEPPSVHNGLEGLEQRRAEASRDESSGLQRADHDTDHQQSRVQSTSRDAEKLQDK